MLLLALACKDAATDDSGQPEGTIVLQGSGLAWDAIPSDPAPDPESWVETSTVNFAADRLLVFLDEDTTVDEVNDALGPFGAVVIGGDTELGLMELSLDRPGDAFVAVEDLFPAVSFDIAAVPQNLPPAHISPTGLDADLTWEWATLDGGANWGLKNMRAPYAWNLVDALEANADQLPRVVILDQAFTVHDDIPMTIVASPIWEYSDHGNEAASAIGGRHNDKGIEGVFPTTDALPLDIQAYGISPGTTAKKLGVMKTEIKQAKAADEPVIFSMSLGFNYINRAGDSIHQDFPDSTLPEAFGGDGKLTFADAVRGEGKAFHLFERRAENKLGYTQWLMFCSAGNSNVNANNVTSTTEVRTYYARESGGCSYAARELHVDKYLSIEALDHDASGDRMADFSQRDGTLAAPGVDIGMASTAWYDVASGTSFATPYAAGAAALLWTLRPDADYLEVRVALTQTREVDETAGALDLVLALTEFDAGHVLELADLDDGTVDGRLREEEPATLGDGCIDQADFRALRDALLDFPAETGNPTLVGDEPLTGPAYGRDLNGDGLLFWDPDKPTWWAEPVPEQNFSRFDLNGDGTLDFADVVVMKSVWGQCADGSTVTPDFTADELGGYVRSADLWIPVEELTLAWVGDQSTVLDPADAVLGLVEWTVPVSACTGTLQLRTINSDGTLVFRTGDSVTEGMDILVDGGELKLIDSDVPLVHWQSSSEHYGLLRYSSDGTTGSSTEIDSDGQVSTVALDGTIAVESSKGLRLVPPGATTETRVRDGDLSDEYMPWFWAEDSSGVLGRNTSDIQANTELIWVDVETLSLAVVAPELAKRWGDWPAVDPGGRIWLTGQDGRLYVVPTRDGADGDYDEWLDELLGGATCDDSITLPPATRVDRFTSGHWRLVHTGGSPISADGHVLVTDDTSLVVMSSDGSQTLVLDDSWTARGGHEMVYIWPGDGVSWSGDGQYVAWLDNGHVKLADLGTQTWSFPTSATVDDLGAHEGGTLAIAPFSKRIVVGLWYGPASDPWMELQLIDFSGNTVGSPIRHDLRYGNPAFSGSGSQLVYSDEENPNKPNIAVVNTSDGGGVLNSTTWGSGYEGYPSWGLEIPHY